jgi:hypothetical protein
MWSEGKPSEKNPEPSQMEIGCRRRPWMIVESRLNGLAKQYQERIWPKQIV